MLGRVNGPYKGNFNNNFVAITLYNEDGSLKSRTNISHSRYVKEYEQGLHRYTLPATKIVGRKLTKIKEEKIKSYKECFFCQKTFLPIHRNELTQDYFCSESCKRKFKRRQERSKKFDPIRYHKQIVIRINGLENENYLIVYNIEPGNRETYFIDSSKTTIELSEDSNRIHKFYLKFDIKDAVRVRLVPGFKKLFWITETGVLISRRTRKVLSQTLSKTGYWTHITRVGGRNGKSIGLRIHRCVGWAFIPNPDNKPFINHKDGVKTNNHYSNLEWVTNQENIDHAWSMGLVTPLKGEQVGGSKLTNAQAQELRKFHLESNLSITKVAKIYNIHHTTASRCINFKRYKIIQ